MWIYLLTYTNTALYNIINIRKRQSNIILLVTSSLASILSHVLTVKHSVAATSPTTHYCLDEDDKFEYFSTHVSPIT